MNALINDEAEGYSWEGDYEQTWKDLDEDESGKLRTASDNLEYRSRKRQMLEKQSNIRLSMMRHMFVVIDSSSSMTEKDLKPSRFLCVLKTLEKFVYSYFDQNPISQLGIILTRKKAAEKICELSGNPKKIIESFQNLKEKMCQSEPSLQNSLELSMATLKHIRSNSSREVLFIVGSLTTCDPGDVFTTIRECKKLKIRCSVIGLAAETYVYKKLCAETEGIYSVILHELHLHDVFQKIAFPLPNSDTGTQTLMRMGFPQHRICKSDEASLCMCHLEEAENRFSTGGYFCPTCDSKYCELPIECKACGLTLIMAPHLARSYHHLFPLNPYKEIQNETHNTEDNQNGYLHSSCFGCQQAVFSEKTVFQCEHCKNSFCIECDIFIHETLHSCPGCRTDER